MSVAIGERAGIIDVRAIIPSGPEGPAAALREAARAGIGTIVATHRDALLADPDAGNRRALDAAAASPDRVILPVAVVAPIRSGARERTAAALRGAVAAWVGTAAWGASAATASLATDECFAAVGRAGIPLIVPVDAWGDASAIGARTAGLGIPVILSGAHYAHIVDDLAAAERWPHLHLETSRLAHLGAIENAVRRIGAERVLFGSGLPDRAPTAPLNAIVAAAIPDDAKRAILGGNAARLLGLPAPRIELPAAIRADGALDVHGHLPPAPWDVPELSPSALVATQARAGIARTVVSSIEAIASDVALGNAAVAAAVAAEPGLLGYLVADARRIPETRAGLRRWGDAPGVVGVKVHSEWSGVATAAPAMAALFDLLADHGRPVKIHVAGDGWPAAIRRIAEAHPALPIIAAHAGPGAPSLAMAQVAADVGNLSLELASSHAALEEVRAMVALAGRDRFLFGSDSPLLDPSYVLGTYADAGLDPARHGELFRDRAVGLFGVGG